MMECGQVEGLSKPVSRLIQGTMTLHTEDLEAGFSLMDSAVELGFTTLDTGHVYGGGESERVLGRWMEARSNRDQVVIISKSAHHNVDRKRVTPFDISADIHDSLARLRTDYVDLHLLHRDDPRVPVGPIVEALNEHLASGRIRAFGGSNWRSERIQEANTYARSHGLAPFVASSPHYSLAEEFDVPWEDGVSITGSKNEDSRRWYEQTEMPVLAWSSLSGGFFSGRVHRGKTGDLMEPNVRAFCHEPNFLRLDRVTELAAQKNVSVPQLALAWVLHQPMNLFPIVGGATPEEQAANLKALEIELTKKDSDWLNLV
jgi:aryl-alcohol dehydrogenase-like predicted oxidoreductase